MGNSCFSSSNSVPLSNSSNFKRKKSKNIPATGVILPDYSFHSAKYSEEKTRLKDWTIGRSDIIVIPSLLFLSSKVISQYILNTTAIDSLPIFQLLKDCITYHLYPIIDRNFIQENVELLNNGRTLRYRGRGYSTSILFIPKDRGFSVGRYSWLIKIEKSRVPGWMQIGVVNKERKQSFLKTIWDGNPHPFRKGEMAQRNNGNFHSGIKPEDGCLNSGSIFSGGYTTGDVISVQLDMKDGEIFWFKNGEKYGSPMIINGNELFPSISLDSPLEEVSLLALYSQNNPF
ncbi:hypothetical protein LOD99_5360 [Oopsacas minuta]|uniref:B30.2/SPRY domain-containing protein n=1 Tax=Oopsacas minuta TaxID=111878 RepID=A0AAV7JQQ7_9METZ|nr:hypothetical protein LOD99_5360 [Oopsacas minuta]